VTIARTAPLLIAIAGALAAASPALAQSKPYLAMLMEWQQYAASDDLARLPHGEPRIGVGIEAGVFRAPLGSVGLHGVIDLGNPLADPFTPLEDESGYRVGLRLRSPWLPPIEGARPRFELAADRVRASARYLNDDHTTGGWSLQLGVGVEAPLGEGFGLLVSIGYGWEDLGDLNRADGATATLPGSTVPLSLDRSGWYLRLGAGAW